MEAGPTRSLVRHAKWCTGQDPNSLAKFCRGTQIPEKHLKTNHPKKLWISPQMVTVFWEIPWQSTIQKNIQSNSGFKNIPGQSDSESAGASDLWRDFPDSSHSLNMVMGFLMWFISFSFFPISPEPEFTSVTGFLGNPWWSLHPAGISSKMWRAQWYPPLQIATCLNMSTHHTYFWIRIPRMNIS